MCLHFIIIILLSTNVSKIIHGQKENKLLNRKITNGTGIFYEPISKLQTYSGTFNLLIHVNTTAYVEKFGIIEELLNNNTKLCSHINDKVSNICNTFNPTLHMARVELTKKYNSLISLQKGTRSKRGLINAVGDFEEWAFGLVSDNSYQNLQQEIQQEN